MSFQMCDSMFMTVIITVCNAVPIIKLDLMGQNVICQAKYVVGNGNVPSHQEFLFLLCPLNLVHLVNPSHPKVVNKIYSRYARPNNTLLYSFAKYIGLIWTLHHTTSSFLPFDPQSHLLLGFQEYHLLRLLPALPKITHSPLLHKHLYRDMCLLKHVDCSYSTFGPGSPVPLSP